MKTLKLLAAPLIVASMTMFSSSAFAVDQWATSWSSWDSCSRVAATGTTGNSYSCLNSTSSNSDVTINAWSTTGGSGDSGGKFAKATLANWTNNLGVYASNNESGTPQHSMDNYGPTDAILLHFETDVALNQVNIGWAQSDADISVLAYTTGSATTAYGVMGSGSSTAANLVAPAGGWSLVGNYDQDGTSAVTISHQGYNDAARVSSSWWLISAYNPGYGSATAHGGIAGDMGTNVTTGNYDFIKVSMVSGDHKKEVPEPGGMILFGIGLLGLMASRRRITK